MKILNLCRMLSGDIHYTVFSFPDGQLHFQLVNPEAIGEWEHVQIITRLTSLESIGVLGLVVDSVRSVVKGRISVNISYLLGARMDRPIAAGQPFTLKVLAGMINAACEQANDVRILDPHSPKSLELINRSTAVTPTKLFLHAMSQFTTPPVVVVPDEGAKSRTFSLLAQSQPGNTVDLAFCVKKRDPHTGNLSGFALQNGDVKDRACLIVDDLCDGGGTFAGIADVLHQHGVKGVYLCVTHAILSKGPTIQGIKHIFCTDSYKTIDLDAGITQMQDYMLDWVKGPKE